MFAVQHAAMSKLLLEKRVLWRIQQYHRDHQEKEVGGLLLGYRRDDAIHAVKATMPFRNDKRTAASFVRQSKMHQIVALVTWVTSGFKIGWIGEWHSHPEGYPQPSGTDLNTWRNQVDLTGTEMAYVILGTKAKWIGLHVPNHKKVMSLSLLEETDRTLLFGP